MMTLLKRSIVLIGFIALAVLFLARPGIHSAKAAPAGWTTNGAKIVAPNGSEYRIAGTNWYGTETRDKVFHGLYAEDYTAIIDRMKGWGVNTIRIPFSNEVWETNAIPSSSKLSACPSCKGKSSRDIVALVINYAGSQGMHIILDNHRSNAGNSAQENGLWYYSSYTESAWINDWVNMQHWVHGIRQTGDSVTVNYLASDGLPIVLGFDLRNEPHTPSRTAYLTGSTWGSGDGIDPATNPNPNPFAVTCASASTCHDWRLAAERAGDKLLGDADANGWAYPLILVEGIGEYPAAGGNAANGPYDGTWWGGSLLGVNGNSTNSGGPIVLNSGGTASSLGAPVYNQVVYSAHDYGPTEYVQTWFNANTCYKHGCGSSSLADVWYKEWAYINAGGVNPVWPGHASYPWSNTGHTSGYTTAPMYIGEFGTGKTDADLYSATRGSQGQWFNDLANFIQSSFAKNTQNDSGYAVTSLQFTYWAINAEDGYGVFNSDWIMLANQKKVYSALCFMEVFPVTNCGSTGALPAPQ
jgi:endoglucanase